MHRRSALVPAVPLLTALLAGIPAAPAAALDAAGAARDVRSIVARSGLGSSVSVTVATQGGRLVVAVRGDAPRLPASNQKVPSIVTVLDRLGPDARLSTTVVAAGPVRAGVLSGSLYLVGGGDPMLSTRAFARARYRPAVATLDDLAALVRRAGIRRITGSVIGDGSAFDARRDAPGWKPGFSPYECAPLSALSVNRNETANGFTFAPELSAARLFRGALRARGIRVDGRARVGAAPETARMIAVLPSPPLSTIVRLMGKDSDNFAAEMLVKATGAFDAGRGTTAAGARTVVHELEERSVPTDDVVIVDGSGLSLRDRTTTSALVATLVSAARDPRIAAPFRASLAIGGVDGTLRSRFTTRPARGRVRAKTGTLNEASSLSGYAGKFVFSVLVNGRAVDHSLAHEVQDRVATALVRRS